jgi:hypothetical protein
MPKSLERKRLTERLANVGEVGLGLVLAATPVALWIAWTAALVVWIMLVAAVCAVLLALLMESSRPGARDQDGPAGADGRVLVPEAFVEEVHRLFPLTYHHSRHETARFREAMKRLSRLIEGSKPGDTPR